MENLRRTIHPEVRILSKSGRVQYIASDETLDSYGEVIRAKGWRFTNFKKNAPFLDSHDSSSLMQQVGIVTDFKVEGNRLIETVQWAIDVPENTLAQLGWKMTAAGYLKAVSVGFWPTKMIKGWDKDRPEVKPVWDAQLKELGLPPHTKLNAIYLEQEQIELSAVVLGANPNALLAAHKAGAINDRDVELVQKRGGPPVFQIPFDSKPESPSDMKSRIVSLCDQLAGATPAPSATTATQPAAFRANLLTAGRAPLLAACEARLDATPGKRAYLRAIAKVMCHAPRTSWGPDENAVSRALTTGDSGLGQAVSVAEPLAADLYSLLLDYSDFRDFVIPMDAGKKKLAAVTGKADAAWLTAANQGTAIPETSSISGASISPEVATVGALVNVSGEALGDGAVTFEGLLLMALVEGLGYRISWSCFQADGTDDQTDGGMTGIFAHGSVTAATAAAGGLTVAVLVPDDFAAVIGAVAPSALTHPCRWWIAPAFLPSLLKIRDDGSRLLKPPTGPDDEWRIHGFPITWGGACPTTDGASAKVAAFGREDAFTVGLRQDFEIRSSAHSGSNWAANLYSFRAIARARCLMRDATSLATLKLAAA